jgi:hypothetical protein
MITVEINGAAKVGEKPWLQWYSVGLSESFSERLLHEMLGSLRGWCENCWAL